MNEFHNAVQSGADFRKTLLATASAVALVSCVSLPEIAQANDGDRPTVWIEGGWHFEDISGKADTFLPPMDAETRALGLPSSIPLQNILAKTYGAEGSISFRPRHTDWVFSISARYGRARTARNIHQEKDISGPVMKGPLNGAFNVSQTPVFTAYAIEASENAESHAILDFQAGKDLGIGLFGHGTESVVSFGARYAQFNYRSRVDTHAVPSATFEQLVTPGILIHPKYRIQTTVFASWSHIERRTSFHALGPSISMSNTTGLLGEPEDGQLAIDWGANAAILFGKQRAEVNHHASVQQFTRFNVPPSGGPVPTTSRRSRFVAIPNVGGFAALSYRFTNAKVSAGYRADFFFGAQDGGLDTRNAINVGFHGPFATLSVGLGG